MIDAMCINKAFASMRCLRSNSYQRPVQLTSSQFLVVIEVMQFGSVEKQFQAVQQTPTIAS